MCVCQYFNIPEVLIKSKYYFIITIVYLLNRLFTVSETTIGTYFNQQKHSWCLRELINELWGRLHFH